MAKKCLVTGAAGFIGSHLCEELLSRGHEVVGVDLLTSSYDPAIKRRNLMQCVKSGRFSFIMDDVAVMNEYQYDPHFDWVFHLAARPGVRTSWGRDFASYVHDNVLGTQNLLELCLGWEPERVIFASSSSVYGDRPLAAAFGFHEELCCIPISPYGATKLAGEELCGVYWLNYRVPVSIARLFTVYGPRQRPDMAFACWIKAIMRDEEVKIYGNGEETRDFTHIEDAVNGLVAIVERGEPGRAYNISGGGEVTLNRVLHKLSRVTGREVKRVDMRRAKGDPVNTMGNNARARKELGWEPKWRVLGGGLESQVKAWKESQDCFADFGHL